MLVPNATKYAIMTINIVINVKLPTDRYLTHAVVINVSIISIVSFSNSNSFCGLISWVVLVKLFSSEGHRTHLLIYQHWCRTRLRAPGRYLSQRWSGSMVSYGAAEHIENNVCTRVTVSALTRELFWCIFPELRSNEGNKHQNNARVSAETIRHQSTYIILFLTWYTVSVNDDKNDDLYTSSSCLIRSVFVLLMTSQFYRQLWRDDVNSDI